MAEIAIRGATKTYDGGVLAVDAIDLDAADGELLVLVGPSGCGKSTLLRMVAGLEEITSGTVHIGGRDVTELAPKDRDVAMVFQSYALYPHMTVRKNIGYPLRLAKVAKPELERRVTEVARLLQLDEVLDRRPSQLSGGQRQRVAMGRALVREPQAFLMDEPLSNLDAKLRVQMRAEIARLQRELAVTTIYVTHDQIEAMTMGDRVAVLRDGMLQQVDEPERLYAHPRNLFVAAFIGSPSMNLVEGRLELDGDAPSVLLGDQRLGLPASVLAERPALKDHAGQDLVVGMRPEHLTDPDPGNGAEHLTARVELREALGSELLLHLRTNISPAVTEATKVVAADVDEEAVAELHRQASAGEAMIVARFDPRSNARVGDTVEVAVDTERLHFFDPESGDAIWS